MRCHLTLMFLWESRFTADVLKVVQICSVTHNDRLLAASSKQRNWIPWRIICLKAYYVVCTSAPSSCNSV